MEEFQSEFTSDEVGCVIWTYLGQNMASESLKWQLTVVRRRPSYKYNANLDPTIAIQSEPRCKSKTGHQDFPIELLWPPEEADRHWIQSLIFKHHWPFPIVQSFDNTSFGYRQ